MNNKPIHSIRIGPIEAAIFNNQSERGQWCSVSLSRNYKDQGGNWQRSSSFSARDIHAAIRALQLAAEIVELRDCLKKQKPTQEEQITSDSPSEPSLEGQQSMPF